MTTTESDTEIPDTMPAWSLHWRGQVFHESELTGAHLSIMYLITGRDDFTALDMNPTLGHQRIMIMLSTFLAGQAANTFSDPDAVAESIAKAQAEVSAAPAEEILGSVRYE